MQFINRLGFSVKQLTPGNVSFIPRSGRTDTRTDASMTRCHGTASIFTDRWRSVSRYVLVIVIHVVRQDRFESTQNHSLGVERHFSDLCHAGIGEHSFMRRRAGFSIRPHNPRQHYFFAWFGLYRLAIVSMLAMGYIQLPVFEYFKSAKISGDFCEHPSQTNIC